jgi:hypothetical protein
MNNTTNTPTAAPAGLRSVDRLVSPICVTEEWDDTKLRHAYTPDQRAVALCGYNGKSTWGNEWPPPPNACPICLAILPAYWDASKQEWIRTNEQMRDGGQR